MRRGERWIALSRDLGFETRAKSITTPEQCCYGGISIMFLNCADCPTRMSSGTWPLEMKHNPVHSLLDSSFLFPCGTSTLNTWWWFILQLLGQFCSLLMYFLLLWQTLSARCVWRKWKLWFKSFVSGTAADSPGMFGAQVKITSLLKWPLTEQSTVFKKTAFL